MMRKVILTSITIASLFFSASVMAKDVIRIGLIEPLSGSVAYNGVSAVNGVKLAVKERNDDGGVDGRKIELLVEDGECTPSSSVNAAQRLILQEKVSALIGAFCSSATLAVMPVAKQYETPFLSGVSSQANLTEKGNEYFFRSSGTDALLANAFATLLSKKLDLQKVAYIGVNDDWGRGGVEAFSSHLEALGVQTSMIEYFKHGTTNFYTLLTKLRTSGADGVFVAAETQDGSVLVRQLKQFGIDMKIFGVGAWANSDFIKQTGDAANGIYAAVPYAPSLPNDRNKAFVKTYKNTYGALPGKYAMEGYNAANIMMDAIGKGGSTDSKSILSGLEKTDYQGLNGNFKFTDKGQAYGFNVVLVQIQDGQAVVVDSSPVTDPRDSVKKN